jgi:hypothetical protein
MRKLICLLAIAVTASLGVLAIPSAEAKKKPAAKPVIFDALRKRVFASYEEGARQFQLQSPNIQKLVSYFAPNRRAQAAAEYEKSAADPSRLTQIRDVPVDVKRIVSIRKVSSTRVVVDFCYVSSLYALTPNTPTPTDGRFSLVGSRDSEEWILITNVR